MNSLLNLSFWFDVKPLPIDPLIFWIFLIVCLAVLILGIVAYLLKTKKFKEKILARNIWTKIGNWSISFGIIGLILVFLKQQRVLYLGMRIWFVFWLIIFFIWLVFILKYIFVEVPKVKKEREKKKEFEKYLP